VKLLCWEIGIPLEFSVWDIILPHILTMLFKCKIVISKFSGAARANFWFLNYELNGNWNQHSRFDLPRTPTSDTVEWVSISHPLTSTFCISNFEKLFRFSRKEIPLKLTAGTLTPVPGVGMAIRVQWISRNTVNLIFYRFERTWWTSYTLIEVQIVPRSIAMDF